jgi:MFS family permease
LAALQYGASSEQLGLLGACSPIGYTISCLIFGRLFQGLPGKYVAMSGTLGAIIAAVLMWHTRSVPVLCGALLLYGLSGGAFWPFTSAWMFDFAGPDLSRTRILRYYNVGWTSGTSLGFFLAGVGTRVLGPEYVFLGAAICMAGALVLEELTPVTHHGLQPAAADAASIASRPRVAVALLIAAVIANFFALASRAIVLVNYAELNKYLGFSEDRMGYYFGCILIAQMFSFLFGHVYEPLLGLRRLYVALALSMIAICAAFIYCDSLAVLITASLLSGIVAAVAFQCCIIAATECFSTARAGTTFHEAVVGAGGLAPIPAGLLVQYLKQQNSETLTALRAPFFMLAALIALGLLLQLMLVSRRSSQRVLLPGAATIPETVA